MDEEWRTPALERHAGDLVRSFRDVVGRDLVTVESGGDVAACLYHAPFPVLSHGLEADPVLNYGNAAALARAKTPRPSAKNRPHDPAKTVMC